MIDLKRPVQTRNGGKARIVCTDAAGPLKGSTVLALVTDSDGVERPLFYLPDGRKTPYGESPHDLMNAPNKVWVNMYENEPGRIYFATEAKARKAGPANRGYLTTVEVELPSN